MAGQGEGNAKGTFWENSALVGLLGVLIGLVGGIATTRMTLASHERVNEANQRHEDRLQGNLVRRQVLKDYTSACVEAAESLHRQAMIKIDVVAGLAGQRPTEAEWDQLLRQAQRERTTRHQAVLVSLRTQTILLNAMFKEHVDAMGVVQRRLAEIADPEATKEEVFQRVMEEASAELLRYRNNSAERLSKELEPGNPSP